MSTTAIIQGYVPQAHRYLRAVIRAAAAAFALSAENVWKGLAGGRGRRGVPAPGPTAAGGGPARTAGSPRGGPIMSDAPSISRARSRRSPLPIVVVTMSLGLVGGFVPDTARQPQVAPSSPVELRT